MIIHKIKFYSYADLYIMISQLTLILESELAEPVSKFLKGKNKELTVNNIIFYDKKKIVYRAKLRKDDFIDDLDKITQQEDRIKQNYGLQYFEILSSDSALKIYNVLIIQNMPPFAEKLLSEFQESVFIIPPLILNDWGLNVNIIALSGALGFIQDFLQKNNIKYEIIKVGNLNLGNKILSDREDEVIKRAYDKGYFEQPRINKMSNISQDLGITKSTFMRILRKAEKKIIRNYLDGAGMEL